MAESGSSIGLKGFGATVRRDKWWLELVPVVLVLGAFSVYATWRAFEYGRAKPILTTGGKAEVLSNSTFRQRHIPHKMSCCC